MPRYGHGSNHNYFGKEAAIFILRRKTKYRKWGDKNGNRSHQGRNPHANQANKLEGNRSPWRNLRKKHLSIKEKRSGPIEIMPLSSQFSPFGDWGGAIVRLFKSLYNNPIGDRVDCGLEILTAQIVLS